MVVVVVAGKMAIQSKSRIDSNNSWHLKKTGHRNLQIGSKPKNDTNFGIESNIQTRRLKSESQIETSNRNPALKRKTNQGFLESFWEQMRAKCAWLATKRTRLAQIAASPERKARCKATRSFREQMYVFLLIVFVRRRKEHN